MKNTRKTIAMVLALMLVCMMVPVASAQIEEEALPAELALLEAQTGGKIRKETGTLSEIIELCEIQSGVASARAPRAVITPLTSVSIAQMYYGIISYNWINDQFEYYVIQMVDGSVVPLLGMETFPANQVGKTATGSGAPFNLIVGDYMFAIVESGYSVSWRSGTFSGEGSTSRNIGSEAIFNAAGVTVGSVQYYYVDNNDAMVTTPGRFNYTAHNFDAMYGGAYSRSDSCSVVG